MQADHLSCPPLGGIASSPLYRIMADMADKIISNYLSAIIAFMSSQLKNQTRFLQRNRVKNS
jgi:hypothetical protein